VQEKSEDMICWSFSLGRKKNWRENLLEKLFRTDHVEDQLWRATWTCILGNVMQNELALNTIQWWAMMVLTTEYTLSQW